MDKLFPLFAVLLLLSGCSPMAKSENRTTDTYSSQFSAQEEKLGFLAEYLIMPTEILDTEYHIRYFDNGPGLIPGPSDWNISVALKVDAALVDDWIEDMEEIDPGDIDMAWWDGLSTELLNWESLTEKPVCYKRAESRSYLAVYKAEGIILKYVYTMP